MQLDESEEDLKGQHDQPNAQTETSFQHLCSVNKFGGDPRLYETLRCLVTGEDTNASNDEDFQKAFDSKLLQHLTSGCQAISSDSDGEGSSGPPGKSSELNIREAADGRLYFKGYPECDYLRQVSIHIFKNWRRYMTFCFADQYCFARLEQSGLLPSELH